MQYALNATALEVMQQYSTVAHPKPQDVVSERVQPQPTYRCEDGGIVVYDSRSRFSDEPPMSPFIPAPRNPALYDRHDFDLASDFDRQQFFSLPLYPCFKPHLCESVLTLPDNCLRFDAHFESGNLSKAVQITPTEYHLWLEFDINTQGHTQWYYFAVRNKSSCTVTFAIQNLVKYDSLYLNGMQPLVYSKNKEGSEGVRWHRAGTRISYVKNQTLQPDHKTSYYTLSFDYTFPYPCDTVYFAHCFPYTHTDLMRDLAHYQEDSRTKTYFRVDTLCETLAKNPCPVVTITSDIDSYPPWEHEYAKMMKSAAGRRMMRIKESRDDEDSCVIRRKKRAVVLTARVHPGESNGSFMLKGALEFLLGHSKEAKILRKEYVFKLIPMLNPDGVVYGNYRCSLLGADLNRRWLCPNRILHPTIYHAKRLIQMIAEEREVVLFCDMHGHSMRKNVFVYGCSVKNDKKQTAMVKLIPLLLHQRNKIFSFSDSHFRMEKTKEATARIVAFREINVLNSYTLEASFCGPSHSAALENRLPVPGESSGNTQMTQTHLLSLGKDLCKTLLIFLNPRIFRRKLNELTAMLTKEMGPPGFLTREKHMKSTDTKSTEDLEPAEESFSMNCAMEEIAKQETLMEELGTFEGEEEAKSCVSDDALSDHEEIMHTENTVFPTILQQQTESVSPKRPVRVRRRDVRKSLDNSVETERSTANSRQSRVEEPHSAGQPPQPVRISSILRYYREAETKSRKKRPFSPVKLNQSAFPDIHFFDTWKKRGMEGTHPEPPKSQSPDRPKPTRRGRVKQEKHTVQTQESGGVFESLRFDMPSTSRRALGLISHSIDFRNKFR